MTDNSLKSMDYSSIGLLPNAGQHDQLEAFVVDWEGQPGTTPVKSLQGRTSDEAKTLLELCDTKFTGSETSRVISFEGCSFNVARTFLRDGRVFYALTPLKKDMVNLRTLFEEQLYKKITGITNKAGIFLVVSDDRSLREEYGAALYTDVLTARRGLGVVLDNEPYFNLNGHIAPGAFSAHMNLNDRSACEAAIGTNPSALMLSPLETEEQTHLLFSATGNRATSIVQVHAESIPDAIELVASLAPQKSGVSGGETAHSRVVSLINGAILIKRNATNSSKVSRKLFDAKPESGALMKIRQAMLAVDKDGINSIVEAQLHELQAELAHLTAANSQ